MTAETKDRHIERKIERGGRWLKYRLIVDGVDLGIVQRTLSKGKDGLAGRRQPTYSGWEISGIELPSQQEAEDRLIERSVRFGHIAPMPIRN